AELGRAALGAVHADPVVEFVRVHVVDVLEGGPSATRERKSPRQCIANASYATNNERRARSPKHESSMRCFESNAEEILIATTYCARLCHGARGVIGSICRDRARDLPARSLLESAHEKSSCL